MPVTDGRPRKKEIKRPVRTRGLELTRLRAPLPLFRRGPQGAFKPAVQADSPGDTPPKDQTMTLPEWWVYWWLEKRREIFDFQSSLIGGRIELGGLITDFIVHGRFNEPGLVINVNGEFWHRYTTAQRTTDLNNKQRLEALGFTVVYVLEDEIFQNLTGVMEKALKGEQTYFDSV